MGKTFLPLRDRGPLSKCHRYTVDRDGDHGFSTGIEIATSEDGVHKGRQAELAGHGRSCCGGTPSGIGDGGAGCLLLLLFLLCAGLPLLARRLAPLALGRWLLLLLLLFLVG